MAATAKTQTSDSKDTKLVAGPLASNAQPSTTAAATATAAVSSSGTDKLLTTAAEQMKAVQASLTELNSGFVLASENIASLEALVKHADDSTNEQKVAKQEATLLMDQLKSLTGDLKAQVRQIEQKVVVVNVVINPNQPCPDSVRAPLRDFHSA